MAICGALLPANAFMECFWIYRSLHTYCQIPYLENWTCSSRPVDILVGAFMRWIRVAFQLHFSAPVMDLCSFWERRDKNSTKQHIQLEPGFDAESNSLFCNPVACEKIGHDMHDKPYTSNESPIQRTRFLTAKPCLKTTIIICCDVKYKSPYNIKMYTISK